MTGYLIDSISISQFREMEPSTERPLTVVIPEEGSIMIQREVDQDHFKIGVYNKNIVAIECYYVSTTQLCLIVTQ